MNPEHRATVEPTPEGGIIRFDRQLPYAIEQVWAALTEPEGLADWWVLSGHPVPLDMEAFAALQAAYAEHGLAAPQG